MKEHEEEKGKVMNKGEREFETGSDEFFKAHSELTAANEKRTYDAYQDLDLQSARRTQLQFDQLQNVALQALQNSVESANMVAKQAIRHSDIAIDNQWNPVQQGTGDNITAGSIPANRATDVAAAGVSTANIAVLEQLIQALTTATTGIANVLNQVQPKVQS